MRTGGSSTRIKYDCKECSKHICPHGSIKRKIVKAVRYARTGDRRAIVKSAEAVPSARTAGRRASVKSAAAVASARTAGRSAFVKSAEPVPSAHTAGRRASVKSAAAGASARTGGSSTSAETAILRARRARHSRPARLVPPRATRQRAAALAAGARCSTSCSFEKPIPRS